MNFIQFISSFHLISLVLSTSLSSIEKKFNFTKISNKKRCETRVEDLEKILNDYESNYRRLEQMVYLLERIEENHSRKDYYKKLLANTNYDNSDCKYSARNTSQIAQKSLCPWKYKFEYRKDRYPAHRLSVICTCRKCFVFGDEVLPNDYICMPVVSLMPVLVKQPECGEDGLYKWIPTFEEVTTGCTCGLNLNIIAN